MQEGLLAPRRGAVDPQWDRLQKQLAQSWDWQQRVQIIGLRTSGDDVVLRFLASRATTFVRVHVQHDGIGGGGESYSATTFVSDVRVDCRTTRQQDVTIARSTGNDYTVWLVPEILSGTTYIRFDGTTSRGVDRMAFVALGPNSQKMTTMIVAIDSLNEKLERLLFHASMLTQVSLRTGDIKEGDK